MAGVMRGDVCLYRFAPPDKVRPVLILTRDDIIPYLTNVTIAPITSPIREVPSEVVLEIEDGMKSRCVVNLQNIQTIRQAQLGKRVARLNTQRMIEVCSALSFSLGCDSH